jgi:hypothetical protein
MSCDAFLHRGSRNNLPYRTAIADLPNNQPVALDAWSSKVNEPRPQIAAAPYVTIQLAATITGLTEKAIRRKIEDGKWVEGREYRRSIDGGIFISLKGYTAWLENSKPLKTASGVEHGTQR